MLPVKRAEYLSTRRKILAEAQATLDALDRVYAYLKEEGHEPSDTANLPGVDSLDTTQSPLVPLEDERGEPTSNGDSEKIQITQEVRDAVDGFTGSFTQQIITSKIVGKHPYADVKPAAVANVLSRMAKRGTVKVVRKGYGRAPNTYRKTELWHREKAIAEGLPPEEMDSE